MTKTYLKYVCPKKNLKDMLMIVPSRPFALYIAMLCMLLATPLAWAGNYPPLPKVERTRLTDEEFFSKLDATRDDMKPVLAALESEGIPAAKKVLADHFRQRKTPQWRIDPHARPKHDTRPKGVKTSRADEALRHVYRGHSFGPDIDWLDNPTYAPDREFDKEWSMAFLRMPWWEALGKAYWATGDERYAKEFVYQLHDFIAKYPIPVERTRGSSHPMKYAVPEWRTLEIGNRLGKSWINAFFRFLSSQAMDDNAVCEILKSFWEMGHHLERFSSVRKLSSNWLISETQALHAAGIMFPEFKDAATWLTLAEERLTGELKKQVYKDGVHWELAPGYGRHVMMMFLKAHQFGVKNGRPMPGEYVDILEKMFHYYAYSSINGQIAAFSDSKHSNVRSVFASGFDYFPHRTDFQWLATQGRKGTKPTKTNIAFPYAGHYVMRSDFEADQRFMIVDAGPYGSGHQHEDALSFELSAYGERLITDPGIYRYNYSSPWRKFMVSSLAHNTLAVDNQGQCRGRHRGTWVAKGPMPNIWKPGRKQTYLRSTYSNGYGYKKNIAVKHTRSIWFVDGRYWVLIDRARPEDKDKKEHLYESLFMLTAANATAEANRIVTKSDGANLVMVPADTPGLSVDVVQGQHKPVKRGWKRGGDTVLPNPTAVFSQRKSGPATFALLLYPVPKGQDVPDVKIEFVPATSGDDPVAVRVTLPDGSQRLLVD
jgi:hypothetical protein